MKRKQKPLTFRILLIAFCLVVFLGGLLGGFVGVIANLEKAKPTPPSDYTIQSYKNVTRQLYSQGLHSLDDSLSDETILEKKIQIKSDDISILDLSVKGLKDLNCENIEITITCKDITIHQSGYQIEFLQNSEDYSYFVIIDFSDELFDITSDFSKTRYTFTLIEIAINYMFYSMVISAVFVIIVVLFIFEIRENSDDKKTKKQPVSKS